jgi:FkbM family methyltransferase
MMRIWIRRLLRGLGWELQRYKNSYGEARVLADLLQFTRADVVLDVGANVGQFGDHLLSLGYQGKLVSFEAIPTVHGRLQQHARNRSASWIVAPCAALGSGQGSIDMNISANVLSSSVLPMCEAHLSAAPASKYGDRQTVAMARLDELARPLVPKSARLLIKIDTQGYELEVLKGATDLLPQTAGLQIELSLAPLYEGAPTFVEMMQYLQAAGFEPFGMVPVFRDIRTGRLLQVDGFFTRKGPGSAVEIPCPSS